MNTLKRIGAELKADGIAVSRVFLLPVLLLGISIVIVAWWLGEMLIDCILWMVRFFPSAIRLALNCCRPANLLRALKTAFIWTSFLILGALLICLSVLVVLGLYFILPFLIPALLVGYLAYRVHLFLHPKRQFEKPPGSTLMKVADFLFSPTTVEHVFTQLVADWRAEYFAALNAKRPLKARWISVRYCWAFAKAFGVTNAVPMFKALLRR